MEETLNQSNEVITPVLPKETISSPKKPIFTKPLIALIILLVILSAVYLVLKYFFVKNTPASTNNLTFGVGINFANYDLQTTPIKPSLPEYKISLSNVYNLSDFEKANNTSFSQLQKTTLTSSNFFITKNNDKFWNDNPDDPVGGDRTDDWTTLYQKIDGGAIWNRAPQNSVFVSTDFLAHAYHRLLEKEFEYIENKKMFPLLKNITDTLFSAAVSEYQKQTDPDNKNSFSRVIAYFAIPKVILDSSIAEVSADSTADQTLDTDETILKNLDSLKSSIPSDIYDKTLTELKLILSHQNIDVSPIFGEFMSNEDMVQRQDYTQFTPRSHYNKNSALRSYFRAMMWYGRTNLLLSSPELTRDALNISLLIKDNNQTQNWENIYIPTAFLVGKSDDLGFKEYNSAMEKTDSQSVTVDSITKIQDELKNYSDPTIQSSVIQGTGVFNSTKEELTKSTKGFRFMGQRFTPDAFIFSSLTQGDEQKDPETNQKLPSKATGLEVMSILGSKTADSLTQNWIKTNAPDSNKVLDKNIGILKNTFSNLDQKIWTQNIYWGWLYTLKSLFTEDSSKTGYPMFMKNTAWNNKSLQTSLGSWTELKHDTLLYAKQSYAEMGAGGSDELPAVPKGYVEPNITFLDRLIALEKMTYEGLNSRGLMDDNMVSRNENFIKALNFFKDIAVKELQNETISDDDFETLRTYPGNLSYLFSNFGSDQFLEKDARSALIADVHTDTIDSQILYEANGIPNYIYVAVKDANGTRLTKGLVYNYFEFTNPIGSRLNDETWQSKNYTTNQSELPQKPDWINSLIK